MKICEECHGTGRVGGPLEARYNDLGGFSCSIGKVGPCEKCGGSGRIDDPSKPEPMVLTGSVAFALERDALKAENDRLRRELEEAKAELARMRPVVEAALREDWLAMVSALAAYVAGAGKGGRVTREQLVTLIAAMIYQRNAFGTLDDAFAEAEMIVNEGERRAKKR